MGIVGAMLRSAGSVERLVAELTGSERARLACKLAVDADSLMARAQQVEAQAIAKAQAAGKEPAVIAAAAQVLRAAGWTVAPP